MLNQLHFIKFSFTLRLYRRKKNGVFCPVIVNIVSVFCMCVFVQCTLPRIFFSILPNNSSIFSVFIYSFDLIRFFRSQYDDARAKQKKKHQTIVVHFAYHWTSETQVMDEMFTAFTSAHCYFVNWIFFIVNIKGMLLLRLLLFDLTFFDFDSLSSMRFFLCVRCFALSIPLKETKQN